MLNMDEFSLETRIKNLKELNLKPVREFNAVIEVIQHNIDADLSVLQQAGAKLQEHYDCAAIFYTQDSTERNLNYIDGAIEYLQRINSDLSECKDCHSSVKVLRSSQSVALESAENCARNLKNLILSLNAISKNAWHKSLDMMLKQDVGLIESKKKVFGGEFYSSIVLELWDAYATEFQILEPLFKKTIPACGQVMLAAYVKKRTAVVRALDQAVQKDNAVEGLDKGFFGGFGALLLPGSELADLFDDKAQLHGQKELLAKKLGYAIGDCRSGLDDFGANIRGFYERLQDELPDMISGAVKRSDFSGQKQEQIKTYTDAVAKHMEALYSAAGELHEQKSNPLSEEIWALCTGELKEGLEKLIGAWSEKNRNNILDCTDMAVFYDEQGEVEASSAKLFDLLDHAYDNLKILALGDLGSDSFKSLYGEK